MDTSQLDPKLDSLERDIAERLRPVCDQMSPEDFLDLVRDIARVKTKYEPKPYLGGQISGTVPHENSG